MTEDNSLTNAGSLEYVSIEKIQKSVYTIRGEQVMLDRDLAEIYGYEVKVFNQQVKRNISRFPSDFMFQLTRDELPECLKSQFVTLNKSDNKRGLHVKKLPYAFTEQGIYMLATVLHGELAEQQSIYIMRAFREMRHIIQQNSQLMAPLEALQLKVDSLIHRKKDDELWKEKTDSNIQSIEKRIETLSENFLLPDNIKEIVIYKNEKFEADKAYADIFSQAKKTIFVIDDYVNIKTLCLLKHKRKGVNVILFTENKGSGNGKLSLEEVNDFNSEYPSLILKPNHESHDRYIILDYKLNTEAVFHCGASAKDAGSKVCGINRIEKSSLLYPVIDELLK